MNSKLQGTFSFFSNPLVSSTWLLENMNEPSIKIVEAVLAPVGAKQGWESEYKIPGAVKMDINKDFSDTSTDLPHMLPEEEEFSKAAGNIGIDNDSIIVLYDQVGTYGSARAWWMFKAMGHEKVLVLEGGIRDWLLRNGKTEARNWPEPPKMPYRANLNKMLLETKESMISHLTDSNSAILDARSEDRFYGKAPEPRPGLRGGHMPNSSCLPFPSVMDAYYLKSPQELKIIFEKHVRSGNKLVCTCGSGVTASILALAAVKAGYHNFSVYDGSWAEWGMPGDTPVITGGTSI